MEPIKTTSRKSDLRLILFITATVLILFCILTILFVLTFKSKNTHFNAANPMRFLTNITNKLSELTPDDYTYKSPVTTYSNTTESSSTSDSTEFYYNNVTNDSTNPTPTPIPTTIYYDTNDNLWDYEPSCINYTINTPAELASNGCYDSVDYKNISESYSKYLTAKYQKEWAETGIDITCDDKEFFKDSCSDYEKSLDKAEADLIKYKSLILELIKKGK